MSRRIVLVDIGAGLQLLGFLPAASAGEAYSARLTGRGGSAPYTYTLVAGALPAGLYLDRDTGTLAGTTTAPGDYAISVQLTDLAGSTLVRHFVLQVTGAVVAPLQLTGDAPAGRVGVVYSYPYSATGGKTPRVFTVASGALPPGLALSAGGLLAGTPTAAGNYAWTVRVTDSYGTTADLVDGAAIAYATLALSGNYPAGQVGTAYSADLTISGGNGVYSNPRVTSGSLPTGLALSIVGNKLRLSGTPTTDGIYDFSAGVDSGDSQSAANALTMSISPLASPATTVLQRLVAWWNLDDLANSARIDSLGHWPLDEINTVDSIVDDVYGRVASFSASARLAYPSYKGSGPAASQDRYTYFGYINPQLPNNGRLYTQLICRSNGGIRDGLYICVRRISSTQAAIFLAWGQDANSRQRLWPDPAGTDAVLVPQAQWTWFAITIEPGTATRAAMRINGGSSQTSTLDIGPVDTSSSFNVAGYDEFFVGYMSRVGIVAGDLSDAEAAYLGPAGGIMPNYARLLADAS